MDFHVALLNATPDTPLSELEPGFWSLRVLGNRNFTSVQPRTEEKRRATFRRLTDFVRKKVGDAAHELTVGDVLAHALDFIDDAGFATKNGYSDNTRCYYLSLLFSTLHRFATTLPDDETGMCDYATDPNFAKLEKCLTTWRKNLGAHLVSGAQKKPTLSPRFFELMPEAMETLLRESRDGGSKLKYNDNNRRYFLAAMLMAMPVDTPVGKVYYAPRAAELMELSIDDHNNKAVTGVHLNLESSTLTVTPLARKSARNRSGATPLTLKLTPEVHRLALHVAQEHGGKRLFPGNVNSHTTRLRRVLGKLLTIMGRDPEFRADMTRRLSTHTIALNSVEGIVRRVRYAATHDALNKYGEEKEVYLALEAVHDHCPATIKTIYHVQGPGPAPLPSADDEDRDPPPCPACPLCGSDRYSAASPPPSNAP